MPAAAVGNDITQSAVRSGMICILPELAAKAVYVVASVIATVPNKALEKADSLPLAPE